MVNSVGQGLSTLSISDYTAPNGTVKWYGCTVVKRQELVINGGGLSDIESGVFKRNWMKPRNNLGQDLGVSNEILT
jgi:hypothetical protein